MMATFIRGASANNLDAILLQMIRPENKQQEMVFLNEMIVEICKECHYPCYKFAHNLEGDTYMRVRMKNITLEYIVMKNPRTQEYNSYVQQISKNGQLIYRKLDNPIGTIHVLWANIDE